MFFLIVSHRQGLVYAPALRLTYVCLYNSHNGSYSVKYVSGRSNLALNVMAIVLRYSVSLSNLVSSLAPPSVTTSLSLGLLVTQCLYLGQSLLLSTNMPNLFCGSLNMHTGHVSLNALAPRFARRARSSCSWQWYIRFARAKTTICRQSVTKTILI